MLPTVLNKCGHFVIQIFFNLLIHKLNICYTTRCHVCRGITCESDLSMEGLLVRNYLRSGIIINLSLTMANSLKDK